MRVVRAADDLVTAITDNWPVGEDVPTIKTEDETKMEGLDRNASSPAIYVKIINESKQRFPTHPTSSYATIHAILETTCGADEGRDQYKLTLDNLNTALLSALRPTDYLELTPGQFQELSEPATSDHPGFYRGTWAVDLVYFDNPTI